MSVYSYFLEVLRGKGAGYIVLIDPEKEGKCPYVPGVDAVFVGGSTFSGEGFEGVVKRLKSKVDCPVVLFPGSSIQVAGSADAILFLSLISGRNPKFLIEEHIKAAIPVYRMSIEVIPVGYILVDGGKQSAVEVVSRTEPLARNDIEGIVAHSLAGQFLGMKMIYLEAGSGARLSVPCDVIEEVKRVLDIPLIVGGGIRTPEEAFKKVICGADFIVTGNVLEKNPSLASEFASAVREAGEKRRSEV